VAEGLSDFYAALAQVSFTVMGLWLVVAELIRSGQGQWVDARLAHAVSLQLALLGVMSLLAGIDTDDDALWRFSFGVSGLLSAVLVAARAAGAGWRPNLLITLHVCSLIVLDVAITLMALVHNDALADVRVALTALQVEAILLSLLFVITASLAVWLIFHPSSQRRPGGVRSPV
jgi:hypothetical protein